MKMKKYGYRNFGHIPSYSLKTNLLSFMFGVPNPLKRSQARYIMKGLDIQPGEKILDFGCGSGYLAVEMYRAGAVVTGLDVAVIDTHAALRACYGIDIRIVETGETTEFADGAFDKILASEVLPMIPDPKKFIAELERILKVGGDLCVVNGFGHTRIERLYEEKGTLYKMLKRMFPRRFPETYKDYTAALNQSFATSQNDFLSAESVEAALKEARFENVEVISIMKESVSNALSLLQFVYYLVTGNGVFARYHFYYLHPLLCLIGMLSGGRMCDNHLMIKAVRAS